MPREKLSERTPKGEKGAKPPKPEEGAKPPKPEEGAKPPKGKKGVKPLEEALSRADLSPGADAAARSLAEGIQRLEGRYARAYASIFNEEPGTVKDIDELAKCEKGLFELKLKLFQFMGLESSGENGPVSIVVEGFGDGVEAVEP